MPVGIHKIKQQGADSVSFLVLMTGGRVGERYRLVKEKTVIGRHPGCDIIVDSGSVSRQHAVVEMKEGAWWIEDLGSRNGTLINGDKLNGPHQLESADEIGVCEDRLVFTVGDTNAFRMGFIRWGDRCIAGCFSVA